MKRTLNTTALPTLGIGLVAERQEQLRLLGSSDFAEGVRALPRGGDRAFRGVDPTSRTQHHGDHAVSDFVRGQLAIGTEPQNCVVQSAERCFHDERIEPLERHGACRSRGAPPPSIRCGGTTRRHPSRPPRFLGNARRVVTLVGEERPLRRCAHAWPATSGLGRAAGRRSAIPDLSLPLPNDHGTVFLSIMSGGLAVGREMRVATHDRASPGMFGGNWLRGP
jgi:hypothetical protein